MTDQPTPETAAKLADDPQPSSDSPDYVCALEIHIHLLRAELADERAKKSDALIAAVDDIERLTAERDDAISLGRHALFCVHHTDAERIANTVGGNCPICNKAQIRQLAELAKLKAAEITRLAGLFDAKQSQLKEVNSWLDECVKQRDDANALARNYAERMKRSDAELAEARALLGLLADIRAAVGDPTGRLMQDDLVERCRQLRADRDMWQADAKQRLADRGTLRAALELIAVPMRPDGTYNRDRAACGSIARAALAASAK